MKKIISVFVSLLFVFSFALTALAHPARLNDEAELLSDSQRETLAQTLDEISERQQFDIAVLTVNSTFGENIETFADDYYDSQGYGMGENRDGALLVLDMGERSWYVSSCGYGITAITDSGLELMSESFVPYLSQGDYYSSFDSFASLCDEYVTLAKNGTPVDPAAQPTRKAPFNFAMAIIISLGIGLLIGLISASSMKGKMTSVGSQAAAANYAMQGSLNITQNNDMFLYANVSRIPRVQNNQPPNGMRGGGSGGTITHVSSGGMTHGGGGGRF